MDPNYVKAKVCSSIENLGQLIQERESLNLDKRRKSIFTRTNSPHVSRIEYPQQTPYTKSTEIPNSFSTSSGSSFKGDESRPVTVTSQQEETRKILHTPTHDGDWESRSLLFEKAVQNYDSPGSEHNGRLSSKHSLNTSTFPSYLTSETQFPKSVCFSEKEAVERNRQMILEIITRELKKSENSTNNGVPSDLKLDKHPSKIRAELKLEYNALVDPNAQRFFLNPRHRIHLEKLGLISDKGEVFCSRGELHKVNSYMKDLNKRKIHGKLDRVNKDEQRLWKEIEAIKHSIQKVHAEEANRIRKEKAANAKQRVDTLQKEKRERLREMEQIRLQRRNRSLHQLKYKTSERSKQSRNAFYDVCYNQCNMEDRYQERRKSILELIATREKVTSLKLQRKRTEDERKKLEHLQWDNQETQEISDAKMFPLLTAEILDALDKSSNLPKWSI